jgi:hypothetical protein
MSFLPFCRGRLSLSTLVQIYLNEEEPLGWVEFAGPTGVAEGKAYIDLKTAVLDMLKAHNPTEIHADIATQIESNPIKHKYVIAAGEMRLQSAFVPLTNVALREAFDDVGLMAHSLTSIDSARARAWAIEMLRGTPSLNVSLVCFHILSQKSPEKEEEAPLIKEQILRLIRYEDVRQDARILFFVQRFMVTEAVPPIAHDLETRFAELGSVKYRMLDTVGVNPPAGRDMMIRLLPDVNDTWKHIFIGYLGDIGDSESMAAIREYRDYP